MSFSDNHMFIPNPLTTASNSIAEEATSTGKVEYVAPCDLDIEEFGVLIAVTLGNTITTATGYVLAKVDAAGNETVIELSLIHISEPTRQAEISYAVFCLK